MRIKTISLAAALSVSLAFVPFLAAQDTGNDSKVEFSTSSFTKGEIDYARTDPGYFTINPLSIRITRLEVKVEKDMSYVRLDEETGQKEEPLVLIDSIINIASKIWKLVVDNAPQSNIDTRYAVAYPQGITAAAQLAQWGQPKSYIYGFYAENLYGSKMIDVEYKATYTYGGTYKGKGKFLTAVTVIPTKVAVGWGYRFSMTASVPDSTITNVGTNKDPVAAMQLKLLWKMSTVLKEYNGANVYYVQGDGYFDEIASPFNIEAQIGKTGSALPLIGDGIFQ